MWTIGNDAIEDAIGDDAIKDDAIQDDSIKDDAIQDDAIQDYAIKDYAIKDDAIEDDAIKDGAIEDDTIEVQEKDASSKKLWSNLSSEPLEKLFFFVLLSWGRTSQWEWSSELILICFESAEPGEWGHLES